MYFKKCKNQVLTIGVTIFFWKNTNLFQTELRHAIYIYTSPELSLLFRFLVFLVVVVVVCFCF